MAQPKFDRDLIVGVNPQINELLAKAAALAGATKSGYARAALMAKLAQDGFTLRGDSDAQR